MIFTEYYLYADYGKGWEFIHCELTKEAIMERIKEYRTNAPQYKYKFNVKYFN